MLTLGGTHSPSIMFPPGPFVTLLKVSGPGGQSLKVSEKTAVKYGKELTRASVISSSVSNVPLISSRRIFIFSGFLTRKYIAPCMSNVGFSAEKDW